VALKISAGIPNGREGRLHPVGTVTPDWILGVARAAEEIGYDGVWVNEWLVTGDDIRAQYTTADRNFDALCTLSAIAVATSRVRLTTATLILPVHEPILLAKQAATVDWLSGGRLTLGFGMGGEVEEFRRLYGLIEKPNRGAAMDEYLGALRVLWTEQSATFAGAWTHFTDAECYPKPLQSPLPIHLAGDADGVFRRIAKFGQGWIDSHSSVEEIEAKVASIRGYMEAEGRDPAGLEVTRQVNVAVAATEEEAVRIRERALSRDRRPGVPITRPAGERVVVGTPEAIAERLRGYVGAGVTELCAIAFASDPGEHLGQLQAFWNDVVPLLA
jgi:probable F420-dependent oxidoreductase